MFDLSPLARTWAFVADPRAWLLIVILAAATLGRSGVFRSDWANLLKPWRIRPRDGGSRAQGQRSPRPHPLRDPWFLFLLLISATAVTAWIVMSMTITARPRP